MLLSDIFDYLTYGELSQLFIGGEEEGRISSSQYPKIITNINLGLMELGKRFPVLTKEVVIQLHDHITNYYLDKKYSEYYNSTLDTPLTRYPYIMDSQYYPFNNDVIQIEAVYNEINEELPINDPAMTYSVYTPAYNCLQIPFPDSNNAVSVIYRAYPEKIPTDTTDPFNTEVALPESMLEALLNYVGHRAFSALGMDKPEANAYYAKFEASCAAINNLGILNKDSSTNLRLWSNGWV